MDDQTMFDLFDSLKREVRQEIDGLRQEMRNGFQRVEARLGRQGGIVQGGTRQIARLITWSEEIDLTIAERDQQIAELSRRLADLEKRVPPQAA